LDNEVFLSREVSYYLINAPSIDANLSPKKLRQRAIKKQYYFASPCVDAFILHERLFVDPSIAEIRSDFMNELRFGGVIKTLPIKREEFHQIKLSSLRLSLRRDILSDETIRQKIVQNVGWGLNNLGFLSESLIFWRDTDRELRHLLEELYPNHAALGATEKYHMSEFTNLLPWAYSASLCLSLQAKFKLPGLISVTSKPFAEKLIEYLCSTLEAYLASQKSKQALKGVIDGFLKLSWIKGEEIKIASLGQICGVGDPQKSNMDILRRALEIRNSKNGRRFRQQFWEFITQWLECDDKSIVKLARDKVLQTQESLTNEFRPSWRKRLANVAISTVTTAPISFMLKDPYLALLTSKFVTIAVDAIMSELTERKYAWFFFLYDNITGVS